MAAVAASCDKKNPEVFCTVLNKVPQSVKCVVKRLSYCWFCLVYVYFFSALLHVKVARSASALVQNTLLPVVNFSIPHFDKRCC